MRNFATAVCDFTLAAKQLRNSEFLISRLQIFYFSFADTVFGAALALLRMRKRRAGPGRLEEAFVRKGDKLQCKKCKKLYSIHYQGHLKFCKEHRMGAAVELTQYVSQIDAQGPCSLA